VDTHVWYTIASVLVSIKESDRVTHTTENMGFVHGNEFQCEAVEDEDQPYRGVADVVDVELMEGQWDDGVEEDPSVKL
jgi:hypothetical protein